MLWTPVDALLEHDRHLLAQVAVQSVPLLFIELEVARASWYVGATLDPRSEIAGGIGDADQLTREMEDGWKTFARLGMQNPLPGPSD